MRIAVGSTNPVKIEATKQAFEKVWPNKKWGIVGLEIPSKVSSQPKSDLESIKGATNRAKGALAKSKTDFGVGLEGGVQEIGGKWFDCGWIVIIDKNGNEGIGSTMRLETPPKMVKMLKLGMELGEINDILFKQRNSKQKKGHFGLMTKDALSRTEAYRGGVIVALARFIRPEIF